MSGAARVGYAVAAVLLAGLFATLGTWQWHRGDSKRATLAQQADAVSPSSTARSLAEAIAADQGEGIHPVEGRGHFVSPVLLLDNQQRAGRVGVRVYAIARIPGAPKFLLVDMGWLPVGGERRMPDVAPAQGEREIRGLLTPWPGQGLRLGANPWPSPLTSPVLLTHLDPAEIETALGIGLAPSVLRLAPDLDYGHERDLDVLPNTLPPERHFGYAAQWYALSATVLIVYLVLAWRTRRRSLRRPSA